jgi:hypothetical protein
MCNWGATGTFGSGLDVGIGTCSPSRDLDVNGTTRLRGALYNNSNSSGSFGNILMSTSTGWTWASVTNGLASDGSVIELDGQASALHNFSGTGLMARTGTSTFAARTITAGGVLSVLNGNGISGNPTISYTPVIGSFQNTTAVPVFTDGTTPTRLDLAGVEFNNGGMTLTPGNDRITVPVAGTYKITYTVQFTGASGHKFTTEFDVRKNNTSIGNYSKMSVTADTNTGSDYPIQVSNTFLATLTANDYLDVWFLRTSGTLNFINIDRANFIVERVY